jgi:predicted Zn-dependent protease
LKNQGRFAEAKAEWLGALEMLNQLATAHPAVPRHREQWCDCANDLAWLLVTAPDPPVQDHARALSLACKAAEAYPHSNTYWNTLGAVYFRTGHFKHAVAALDRSTATAGGGTAFDHFYMAMAHSRRANHEQAQRSFALAIQWMEQHRASHAELLRLRDEARSILFQVQPSVTAH